MRCKLPLTFRSLATLLIRLRDFGGSSRLLLVAGRILKKILIIKQNMMENDKTQKPALSETDVIGSVILPTDLRIGNLVYDDEECTQFSKITMKGTGKVTSESIIEIDGTKTQLKIWKK